MYSVKTSNLFGSDIFLNQLLSLSLSLSLTHTHTHTHTHSFILFFLVWGWGGHGMGEATTSWYITGVFVGKHAPDDVMILPLDLTSGEDSLREAVQKAESFFAGAGVDYMIHNAAYERPVSEKSW